MSGKRKSLGKGLDALLGYSTEASSDSNTSAGVSPAQNSQASDGQLRQLPVDLLQRGKYQPRRDLDPQALS